MNGLSRKTLASVIFAVVTAAAATGASAETQWERNHPRRDQVNDRLENQSRRIAEERREGELTKKQAQTLRREDRTIRQEERVMAAANGGHITKAEQRLLNRQLNGVNRQIGH